MPFQSRAIVSNADRARNPERVSPRAAAYLSTAVSTRLGDVMLTRSTASERSAGSIATIAQSQPLKSALAASPECAASPEWPASSDWAACRSTGLGRPGLATSGFAFALQAFEMQEDGVARLGHGVARRISRREAAGQIGDDDAEGVLVLAGFDRNGVVPADVRFMSGSRGNRLASRANNFFYSNDLPSRVVSRHLATNVRVMSGGGSWCPVVPDIARL